MKKILSILGAITLIGTSSTSLVACNKNEYTAEELKELKEKNKINTKDKTIRDNLEWIAPQEKPFNKVDNKYFYVVWKSNKESNWKLSKFQNVITNRNVEIDKQYDKSYIIIDNFNSNNYFLIMHYFKKNIEKVHSWLNYNNDNSYFKSVYRWNLNTKEPDLVIEQDGNLKVKGE